MKRQDQQQMAALIRKGSFDLYEHIIQQNIKRVFSICFAQSADISKSEKLCEQVFITVFDEILAGKSAVSLKELIEITSKNLSKNSYNNQSQIEDSLILSIRNLPEQLRKVLIFYYFNNRDISSVCHLVGMDSTNFRTCLKEARRQLRSIIDPQSSELICPKWSEQIEKFIIDLLTTQEAIDVGQHINECSKCRKYLELLNDDDRKINELANFIQDSFDRITSKIMSQIFESAAKHKSIKSVDFCSRIFYIILLVVFVLAVILISVFVFKSEPLEPNQIIEQPTVAIEQTQNDNGQQNKKDLERVMQCAVSKDIDGLIAILQTAQQPAKLLAAKILTDFVAIEAVETLERVGMQTDEPNNPFTLAAEQIVKNYKPLPEPNYIEDINLADEIPDINDINDVMDTNLPDVNVVASPNSISYN